MSRLVLGVCIHGRIRGRCGVTMYCVDLARHAKADYDTHECDTWWFCPGGASGEVAR